MAKELTKKEKLIAYRNSLIDSERCANEMSIGDLAVVFNLSKSTVHDVVTSLTEKKRKLKRSVKLPLNPSRVDTFEKLKINEKTAA